MRHRIMAAAVAEMNERGIKFTMGDLARRLGVSKRCIYEYFNSKEELISSIFTLVLRDVHEQRIEILADQNLTFQQRLKKALIVQSRVVFCPLEGRIYNEIRRLLPDVWKKIDQCMNQDWRMLEEFLDAGVQAGQFRPVYIPIIEKMIKGTFREITDYHFLAHHDVSLSQAYEYMVDILINGLIPS